LIYGKLLDPENCDKCINHYDLENACDGCIYHYDISSSCTKCEDGYDITSNCKRCLNPRMDARSANVYCKFIDCRKFDINVCNEEDNCIWANNMCKLKAGKHCYDNHGGDYKDHREICQDGYECGPFGRGVSFRNKTCIPKP